MQSMSSSPNGLTPYPIVQAPMAGGASCPPLAAAVCEAGGLGFLAGGYKTADGMYQEIKRLRALTRRPFGVNLFMPQTGYVDPAEIETYRGQLAGEANWYEVSLAEEDIIGTSDDGYEAKLAILVEDPVPVVSFTFGCPPAAVCTRLREAGTYTVVTVTSVEEARAAEAAGPTPSASRASRRAATRARTATTPRSTARPGSDCSCWSPGYGRPWPSRSSRRAG